MDTPLDPIKPARVVRWLEREVTAYEARASQCRALIEPLGTPGDPVAVREPDARGGHRGHPGRAR